MITWPIEVNKRYCICNHTKHANRNLRNTYMHNVAFIYETNYWSWQMLGQMTFCIKTLPPFKIGLAACVMTIFILPLFMSLDMATYNCLWHTINPNMFKCLPALFSHWKCQCFWKLFPFNANSSHVPPERSQLLKKWLYLQKFAC
jgi:hypothetical protein